MEYNLTVLETQRYIAFVTSDRSDCKRQTNLNTVEGAAVVRSSTPPLYLSYIGCFRQVDGTLEGLDVRSGRLLEMKMYVAEWLGILHSCELTHMTRMLRFAVTHTYVIFVDLSFRFRKYEYDNVLKMTEMFVWEDMPEKDPEVRNLTMAGWIPRIQKIMKKIILSVISIHTVQSCIRLVNNHELMFVTWYPFDTSNSPIFEVIYITHGCRSGQPPYRTTPRVGQHSSTPCFPVRSTVLTRYDPCDYDLFTKVKEPLRGTRYNTIDELIRAIGRSIRNINKDGRADGVRRLPNIWQKYTDDRKTVCIKVILNVKARRGPSLRRRLLTPNPHALLKALGIILAFSTSFAFPAFYVTSVCIACSQLEKLECKLNRIQQEYGKSTYKAGSSIEKDFKMQRELNECVRHHQKIIRKLCITPPPVDFLLSRPQRGKPVLQNISANWGDIIDMTQSVTLYIALMMIVFTFCGMGTVITDKYERVREAAWSSDWVGAPVSYQRCILFIIAKSNQTFQLTACKFVPLSNTTMLS
ncbi:hypothetical protein ANN_17306, partial [Periplaneta americana]